MPYVTAADVNDRTDLEEMTIKIKEKIPSLKKMWADMGYQGRTLKERIAEQGVDLEIVCRPRTRFYVPGEVEDVAAYLKEKGFEVIDGFKILPRRWVVEHTFAWIGRYRRMSKDYEFLCHTQETMMRLAMMKTMLKRISKLTFQISRHPLISVSCRNFHRTFIF
jgi:putative transposase